MSQLIVKSPNFPHWNCKEELPFHIKAVMIKFMGYNEIWKTSVFRRVASSSANAWIQIQLHIRTRGDGDWPLCLTCCGSHCHTERTFVVLCTCIERTQRQKNNGFWISSKKLILNGFSLLRLKLIAISVVWNQENLSGTYPFLCKPERPPWRWRAPAASTASW